MKVYFNTPQMRRTYHILASYQCPGKSQTSLHGSKIWQKPAITIIAIAGNTFMVNVQNMFIKSPISFRHRPEIQLVQDIIYNYAEKQFNLCNRKHIPIDCLKNMDIFKSPVGAKNIVGQLILLL